MRRQLLTAALSLLLAALSLSKAGAGTIYVDNRTGSDLFDGKAARPLDANAGPLFSLRGALSRAKPGDTIELTDNGIPYYGGATLSGTRHSALGHVRFVIEGNGAVIDGTAPVPPRAWREVENRLWKITPWRKGHYQLVIDDAPVPEHVSASAVPDIQEIPEGHWSVWRGSIYYRGAVGEDPRERSFRFARHQVGFTLYGIRGVTIRNLTVRFFRLDGFSAPYDCHDVVLENVRSIDNGRAGLAVAGDSHLVVQNSEMTGNREHQVLITGLASVEIVDSNLSEPPTVEE